MWSQRGPAGQRPRGLRTAGSCRGGSCGQPRHPDQVVGRPDQVAGQAGALPGRGSACVESPRRSSSSRRSPRPACGCVGSPRSPGAGSCAHRWRCAAPVVFWATCGVTCRWRNAATQPAGVVVLVGPQRAGTEAALPRLVQQDRHGVPLGRARRLASPGSPPASRCGSPSAHGPGTPAWPPCPSPSASGGRLGRWCCGGWRWSGARHGSPPSGCPGRPAALRRGASSLRPEALEAGRGLDQRAVHREVLVARAGPRRSAWATTSSKNCWATSCSSSRCAVLGEGAWRRSWAPTGPCRGTSGTAGGSPVPRRRPARCGPSTARSAGEALSSRSGGMDGRPPAAYMRSKTGESSASAWSANRLIVRNGWSRGTRASRSTNASMLNCGLHRPRILCTSSGYR